MLCACLLLLACSAGAATWFKDLPEAVAVVTGLVGAATGLLALVDFGVSRKAPRVRVVDAYFHFRENKVYTFSLQADLMNEGDHPDILKDVEAVFYRPDVGFFRPILVCGAKELMKPQGQVLPVELAPRITYRMEGKGSVGGTLDKLDVLHEGSGLGNVVLRCRFTFAAARPVIVRLKPLGAPIDSPFLSRLTESILWMRTLGRPYL